VPNRYQRTRSRRRHWDEALPCTSAPATAAATAPPSPYASPLRGGISGARILAVKYSIGGKTLLALRALCTLASLDIVLTVSSISVYHFSFRGVLYACDGVGVMWGMLWLFLRARVSI